MDSKVVQKFFRDMEAAFKVHPLWAGCSKEGMEGVGEGLEKYVMKKLHTRVFRLDSEAAHDNHILNKLDLIQQFIQPQHLDIDPAIFQNEALWCLDHEKELQNMDKFKAPGDKLLCILNCCKAINNLLLSHSPTGESSADEFLPVLIYLTIKANPPNLHSNLSYIQKFRSDSLLVYESAYYFTTMLSVENFNANMDAKSLSMDETEFEISMECSRALNLKLLEDSDTKIDQKLEDFGSSASVNDKVCKNESIGDLEDRGARLVRNKDNVGSLFQGQCTSSVSNVMAPLLRERKYHDKRNGRY